ncbi:LPD7 domain-containing protein [Variovorax ureilyticus]|uniref:LPD7 domain-containing protein n=1 Tax=Variovorax ureilyticus TaxID=1836198 RepID=A0ABU8VQ18_9BURK
MATSGKPNPATGPSAGAQADAAPASAASTTAAPRDFAGSVHGSPAPAGRPHPRVPDAIERRYLKVDDRYFFPDRTLAFIDDGNRIRVHTENREVMHSVVAIAEARGWRVIELRGTAAFRQGMWREAALRGIEARGYRPSEAEIRQVERVLRRGQPMRVTPEDPGESPDASSRNGGAMQGRSPSADRRVSEGGRTEQSDGDRPPGSRAVRAGPRPPVKGVLVAAAAAPYKFDSAQRMSFYVMVRTEVGERTIWGADLERALAESASQPRLGEQIVLTQHGTNPVNVRVPTRNDAGELTGEKRILAQRARWSIETSGHMHDLQRQARLLRNGEVFAEDALDRHPGLATAAASLKLAEQYAQRVTADEPSQERLLQAIRERLAAAVEQGRAVHLPDRRLRPDHRPVRQRGGRSREEPNHERF